jgi:tRNA modification GTPase
MHEQDTICAVSTPPGEGGIGIIRVSGRDAVLIASGIFRPRTENGPALGASHTLRYGHVVDPATGELVDEALVSVMRAPATYTREDVVEINCHGGMVPLWRTMDLLAAAGARQAEPGEFTKRAFLNGRIDLAQAEAVMDIIRAKTGLALRAANEQLRGGLSAEISVLRDRLISIIASVEAGIDFPEDIESEVVKTLGEKVSRVLDGIDGLLSSASFGRILRWLCDRDRQEPNVGKSSLLNALPRQDRAVVTEVGRRDVPKNVNVAGVPLGSRHAGIKHSRDVVGRRNAAKPSHRVR